MAKFGEFCKVASSYADVADFVTVYIKEAHPSDGFVLKNNVNISNHFEIEDRIEAAKHLLVNMPTFPIVCDDMTEEANYAYAALPERLYIVHRGKIAYEGGRGPVAYFISDVENWLDNFKKRDNKKDFEVTAPVMKDLTEDVEKYSGSKKVWARIVHAFFK